MKSEKKTDDYPDLQIRAATIEIRRAEGDNAVSVSMSVSSEEPVLTVAMIDDKWERVYEVLDHGDGSVDMSRCKDGLVVLDRHFGDQIGLIPAPKIENRKLGGRVEFCSGSRAQEIGRDAMNGLRRNVSVGYVVAPKSYRAEGVKDGIPVVRAMSWTPYEASFEPVPADTTVGVNRAAEIGAAVKSADAQKKEIRKMNPKEIAQLFARAAKYGIDAAKVESIDMADAASARAALDTMIVEKQEADLAKERKTVIELKAAKPPVPEAKGQPIIGGDVKTEEKVVRKYSVLNVLRRAAGLKVDCGFEDEINDECRRQGLGSKRGGQFVIPHAVLANRTLTVSGTSSATVGTVLDGSQYIDVLRSKSILGPLGVRFMTGLTGNIAIPKMIEGATGYWVAEATAITGSTPTLGQVNGTPHTSGVMVDISRLMLLQSTPSAEDFIRNEITERLARTLQLAVFCGTGNDGQPSAITAAAGINNPSVTTGAPTYTELLGFPGNILADNAEADGQRWAMTGKVWQKLAGTFTDGTAKAEKVLDFQSKTCLGFPYFVSEDVGANSLFFGDFSTVVVGVWGAGIDLNMDTATLSSSGGLRLVGLQDVDVMVRLGQALAYNAAVTN
mgnify:CR=1 FL=1